MPMNISAGKPEMRIVINKVEFVEWYLDNPRDCLEICQAMLIEGARFDLETIWGELGYLPARLVLSHQGLQEIGEWEDDELSREQLNQIPFDATEWTMLGY